MKKLSLSPVLIQRLKNVSWLALYLFLFVFFPLLKMRSFVSGLSCANHDVDKGNVRLFMYIFLVSMVLSFIPYKLSKFSSRMERAVFIVIVLLIPFLAMVFSLILSGLVCPSLGF